MLHKQYRLKKKRDFEIAFEHGRFVRGALTMLKLWHVDLSKYPKRGYSKDMLKIGFVVGKKVSRSAVKRNRLKRQMREVVRLLLKEGKLRSGNFMIIMAKPEMLGKSYADIEQDITALLQRAKVLL